MKGCLVSRGTSPKVAVCVLRVERQSEGRLLITVTTTFDVSLSSPCRAQSVARPDDALAIVADFLREQTENLRAES